MNSTRISNIISYIFHTDKMQNKVETMIVFVCTFIQAIIANIIKT